MAERLFQSQLRPVAQPLNTFVNPQQVQRAGVSQQPLLGQVSKIATLQQAGTSSVGGFNQFEQMAQALGGLNKNLVSLVDKGFKQYAKGNIEAGYYEALKNQQTLGVMTLQQNQEAGAAEAASMIGQLEKTDPVGASLLREANPWKAIGRRRALAQLAAGQVSTVLNGALSQEAGMLAGIKPGTPELMKIKQEKTQEVLNQFGLTGSEPEATYYVTPVMNKSWDNFTKKQSELYNEELYQSAIESTNQAVNSTLMQASVDGIILPDGSVLTPGSVGFGSAAGIELTRQIDAGLAMLGGKDKIDAMKKIKESLGAVYAMNIPGIRDAIGNIRLGNRRDDIRTRPRWLDANPFELMDYTNSGMKMVKEGDELKQAELERGLRSAAIDPEMGIVGITDEAELSARITGLRGLYPGLRDVDKVLSELISENNQVNEEQYAIPFDRKAEMVEAFDQLTPNDVSLENYPELVRQARAAAALEPLREDRETKLKEYLGKINKAREDFATLPTGAALQSNLSRSVKEDLNDPSIAKLKGRASASFIDGLIQLQGAEATPDSQRYVEFANDVRGLYENAIWSKFTDYRNKTGGKNIPLDQQARLREEAIAEVRKSDAYKEAKERALKAAPPPAGSDGTPQTFVPVDVEKEPSPRASANTIPQNRARQYAKEPVMNQYWVRDEMKSLSEGKSVSTQLYDLATKAGTSTDRYLLEQIKFFPALDPQGRFRGVLEKRVERARQANTPAASNFEAATDPMGNQSYSGRSPGAWLMSMFERPAAAGTLPPSLRVPSLSTPAVNGNWVTPSGYEIVQYVTGDVTAPHDGDALIVDSAGHGGDHYHNHYEFATVAGRKRAAAAFRSAGFRVTSEVREGDPNSHGVGRGLDVAPPLNLPRTVEAEARWSRAANAILGFTP